MFVGVYFSGICIQVSQLIFTDFSVKEFRQLLKRLYSYKTARVVVVIMAPRISMKMFSVIQEEGLNGHFIFIGGDEMTGTLCL